MDATILVRAHTETRQQRRARERENAKRWRQYPKPGTWPPFCLVFDCESRIDERQSLTFLFARLLRNDGRGYNTVWMEWLAYDPDEATPSEITRLKDFVERNPAETCKGLPKKIELLTRSEFVEKVFFNQLLAGNLVVGFNLPFDLSRIAEDARSAHDENARRKDLNSDWLLILSRYKDRKTGKFRDNPFRPLIRITRKDGSLSFIETTGYCTRDRKTKKMSTAYFQGRLLDLRTLAFSLRNDIKGLNAWCKEFGVAGKIKDHDPTGRISKEEIKYCRQDVRATVGLLNALRAEFDRHDINLLPDKCFSPASISKAYLQRMNVIPPAQKFYVSPRILGCTTQAYFGGRAECGIRLTPVPVVPLDFHSQYPAVNCLLGIWKILTAGRIQIEYDTGGIRGLFKHLTLEETFKPKIWKQLAGFALVQPDNDVLPVRTKYDGQSENVGLSTLQSSDHPLWYALPDLVVSLLQTGKAPKILKAFRVVPVGVQKGLDSVALCGKADAVIKPQTDDFFREIIEMRDRVKADEQMPKVEKDGLEHVLKIFANAGAYGIFIEVNPELLCKPKGLEVWSGDLHFRTETPPVKNGKKVSFIRENQGPFYFPPVASLIAAGGRLLLGMLDRCVRDAGGVHVLTDTDSLVPVAIKKGGLVPGHGGSHRLPDGCDAVKALSHADVRGIVARFEQLNPFSEPLLKVEHNAFEREIWGYMVSSKRYCLFKRTPELIKIVSASASGLGYLYVPKSEFDKDAGAPDWVVSAWKWIAREALGLPQKKKPWWFDRLAMSQRTISTPEVLKVLQKRERNLPYRKRFKPFNFCISPQINGLFGAFPYGADPNRFALIAPFSKESAWKYLECRNVHDGKAYYLVPFLEKDPLSPIEASPLLLKDVIDLHTAHEESKRLGPDGKPCGMATKGLLNRMTVVAKGCPIPIGKESDRRWADEEDINERFGNGLTIYRPNEKKGFIVDAELQRESRKFRVRVLAKQAGVSTRTIQACRNGMRIQKRNALKIWRAIARMKSQSRGLSVPRNTRS